MTDPQNAEQIVMANRMNNVPKIAAAEPAPPILTGETVGVVTLRQHDDVRAADREPIGTVSAGGFHHGVVAVHADSDLSFGSVLLRNQTARGNPGQMATPDREPARTLTASVPHSLIVPYQSEASRTTEPVATGTTRDRLALLVPYTQGNEATVADEQPVGTITTKAKQAVVWTDEDVDACTFRMFALHEIAGAMALDRHADGSDYIVTGNKRERMAQYGNAVTPPAMALIVERLLRVIEAETFTDMFCGAGGSSLGATFAGGRLRMALNHWERAIETHNTNFPDADHDCADVSQADPRRYPPTDILMASPECTNHSIAKGAARRKPQGASLFDDGPGSIDEQDRSRATMWDVVRFTEAMLTRGKPYKAIVVENVVDAFKWGADDNGQLFDAWLLAIRALGYEHEIVWLNSMFAHGPAGLVPQSRDRMYVVFWLKGARRPDLRFTPTSWCPACSKVVAGQQAWKRLDRRQWGRYGPQYFYQCPDCHGTVLPGAAPAAAIIDRSLPAVRIGDREKPLAPNTLKRIRRGLERLSNEPFAIRLLQSGAPKPTTLPLVTLTARHDMAMVTPVAGNTFERTPGNRARDAGTRPLDTVHGTLDRAIVVPPNTGSDARPDREPSPTQTTTTRGAVVTPGASDV